VSMMSRLMSRVASLPPAETRKVAVERGVKLLLPDGVILFADRYYPPARGLLPTILFRTAYGRKPAGFICRLFAERGFQVVIQSSRGTDESGGVFDPFRQERDDGNATLEWLKEQSWFNGQVAMSGASYLGYTQWAIASSGTPLLKALSTQTIGSDFRTMLYHGGALALEVWMGWLTSIHTAKSPWQIPLVSRRVRASIATLPLAQLDEAAFGTAYPFWRSWLAHESPNDPYWGKGDFRDSLHEVTAPNHMVGGWFDFFLPNFLRDYQTMAQAGREPYLTIGPWTHFDSALQFTGMREGLAWLRAHLLGDRSGVRQMPVRIYVMGANEWRDLPAWPPVDARKEPWYLQFESGLSTSLPQKCEPDRYRYDPSNPTPSVGGFARTIGRGKASQDNRALEARPDVLTYTGAALSRDMEIIGPVSAELFVKSSVEHTDFFVRLCDVYPDGKSMNVTDGLLRIVPGQPAAEADGTRRACVELWPTAYRFTAGHRIRVQVSSGAFPRWNRNLGTGEPLATATAMRVADQSVCHDPAHPSAVFLPVSGS
jgi:putative CocE/NonD family hydrolase